MWYSTSLLGFSLFRFWVVVVVNFGLVRSSRCYVQSRKDSCFEEASSFFGVYSTRLDFPFLVTANARDIFRTLNVTGFFVVSKHFYSYSVFVSGQPIRNSSTAFVLFIYINSPLEKLCRVLLSLLCLSRCFSLSLSLSLSLSYFSPEFSDLLDCFLLQRSQAAELEDCDY